MPDFKSPHISQLMMQMHFATELQRKKQLEAAESLLKIVKPGIDYPYEFVCFQITGYRPKIAAQDIICGRDLVEDLRLFISGLSNIAAPQVLEAGQRVYSIDELAKYLKISTKTLSRWRKRGLVAKKYIFPDGSKRFGFTQASVDEFTVQNAELVCGAQKFSHLTSRQRHGIIKRALELADEAKSRRKIIEIIAKETSRASETIRYTLAGYEAKHNKSIVKKRSGAVHAHDASEIYKSYLQGERIAAIMARFGKSKSSIYRIINTRRATQLLSEPIEFIASDEFVKEGALETILGQSSQGVAAKNTGSEIPKPSEDLDHYIEDLKHKPLLTREQEIDLFKRYNFLKYWACMERAKINLGSVSSGQLRKIESCLQHAQQIHRQITESNLRLVVSIASKHSRPGASMAELVSEGNISLLRAVEKFDYTRGFRFSTYATWAIAKEFARKIPAETSRPDRAGGSEFENVLKDMRKSGIAGIAAIEKAGKSLEQIINDNLDKREQYIIRQHFALTDSVIKKKGASLAHIGAELGLSKERVRQLELVALQKLRHLLSPEEFELLTS